MDTSAAQSRPTERLTWTEIRARHPDQWVVLVDIDWNEAHSEIRTALVLGHAPTSAEALRLTRPLRPPGTSCAQRFTGRESPEGRSPSLDMYRYQHR